MPKYQFLTDEWVEAAKAIHEEHAGEESVPHVVRMNLIITAVPFGEGELNAHMDTSDGTMKMDTTHLETPDLTVTLDYDTAKAILVDGDPQAGMQAFMGGKIKVAGDMMKMMALQTQMPQTDITAKVAEEIKAITE